MLEIADRGALAQEFRIGDDDEIGVGPRLADDPLDLVAGADRHRRFGDDHREPVHRARDLARGGIDIGEVRMAVAAPRGRADRDEHRVRVLDRRRDVLAEEQALLADVVRDDVLEPRLEDRNLPALQRLDLARVLVDAGHDMAEIGKARPGNQADIAATNHRKPHGGS